MKPEPENYHIIPQGDLYPHFTNSTCPCVPSVQEIEGRKLYVHNSYDGRELLEKIEDGFTTDN